MDELMLALAESLAHAGPEWVLALGALALFGLKVVPILDRDRSAARNIELRREERKAEESRLREEHDRKMVDLNGRWLVVSEQSAEAMRAMSAQMEVLNTTLQDSKEQSRSMGREVHEIHAAVVPRERRD